MVEIGELKKVLFLKDLPEEMLTKMAGVATIETMGEEAILFRQGENLDHVYALIDGLVFLNSKSPSNKMLTLDEVTPGRCFGVAAIIAETTSTFTAICAQECRIIKLAGKEILALCDEDQALGLTIMTRMVHLFKSRMDRHTRQFIQSIATHPAVRQLAG